MLARLATIGNKNWGDSARYFTVSKTWGRQGGRSPAARRASMNTSTYFLSGPGLDFYMYLHLESHFSLLTYRLVIAQTAF